MGCLIRLLILIGLIYVGAQIVPPYFRYYQYRDDIKQEARFASTHTDDVIRQNIVTNADSLGMPEDAYHVKIARSQSAIRIRVYYTDEWRVGPYLRPVEFDIDVEHSL